MRKRILSMVLTMTMLLGLLPAIAPTAQAAAASAVKVSGVTLNSGTPFLVNGAAAASGTLGTGGCTAYFNAGTGVLTLNNYTFNGVGNGVLLDNSTSPGDLTITLQGNNSITSTDHIGIFVYMGRSLTINGDGNVTLAGGNGMRGIEAGGGLTLNGSGILTSTNIYSCADFTINSGTVITNSFGIDALAGTSIVINGGTVTASSSSKSFNKNPALSGYVSKKVTVSANKDGSSAAAWDNSTDLSTFKYVKIQPNYNATVTVNKDGIRWTSGAPVINLSTTYLANGGIAADDQSNGIYTFSNLDPANTYFIWEKGATDTYTDLFVQSATNSATLNYYTLSLAKGTGIDTVSGGGIYLNGKSANIRATLLAGYEWDKWSDNNTTQNRTLTLNAQTSLTAKGKLKEATAPTLTGSDPSAVTFGYTTAPSMKVSITSPDTTNFTYTYAWYEGSNTTGTAIAGASSDTYTAPAGLSAGTHDYTVRVISTNKASGSKTASADKTFAVTVNKTSGSGSVEMADWTYGETASNPVPTSNTNGTSAVSYTYVGRNGTTHTEPATKPEKAGDYTVTATFAAIGNYNQCTATKDFTIAKAKVNLPTAATGLVYNGSEQIGVASADPRYTVSLGKTKNAGDHTATATLVDKVNYAWDISTPISTDQSVAWSIAKGVLTPSVKSVTGKEYDGNETASGEISLAGAANGELPTATGTFAWTNKNADTTTVDVTGIALSDSWGSNYTLSTASLTGVTAPKGAKISPKALTISAQTAVYNGTATISVPEYATGVGSEKVTLTYTPSAKTSGTYTFGTATNGFTLALSDSNYSVGSAGNLTVSPKSLTIPAKSVTYNGGTSFSQSVTGENGEPVTVTYTSHSQNAGNYTYAAAVGEGKYTVTLSDSTNYSVASGGTLTVNPLRAELTWGYAAPFVYDNSQKSITATVSNKIGSDTFNLTYSGNSGTAKGNYTATVTALGNSNYTLIGASGVTQNWAITAQTVAKPAADSTVFTYTGSEQTYAVTANELYTVTGNKLTVAGSQDVTVSLKDKSNYTWEDGKTEDLTYTFAIAKAPITFAVNGNSYTYDATAKTATVIQKAGQTPAIATGKFSVSYQKSGDASATANKTDAGKYNVVVTINDTNFKHASTEVADFSVGTLTIEKKYITALWKNLHNVYDGGVKSAEFALTGVESKDSEVSAKISGGEQKTVGFHTVTADLTGEKATNYILTNPTGTLVIQKAPVTFAVSGDMVKNDGSAKTATVTATANNVSFTEFTVTYRKEGKAVETPTDIGSYDIYAEIANKNYRHIDGTDGAARKIGVLNIYKDTAPATYTLSFAPGEGGSGSMTSVSDAQSGTARALPACTFTKSDSVFTGWQYNGKTYQPGEVLEQPASNITLTALWLKSTFSINGAVDQNGNPAADAVVTLMLGSRQIRETVTNEEGKYSFANIAPGLYNLVVSKNGVVQTVKVEIIASNADGKNVTLPEGKTNSVVSVTSGTPAIVVGNLEKTFDKVGKVFSQTDKDTVTSGGAVEIKFTAEAKAKDSANADQKTISAKASGTTVELYLDMALSKTVTKVGGATEEKPIPVSDVLLETVVPLPSTLQGKQIYTVYRLHDGKVDTITTSPNPNGEYIKVNNEKTTLTVYCKNFSTYAIAYSTYSGGGGESSIENNAALAPSDHGKVTVAPEKPSPDNKVTITATPDKGYKVDTVTVTDSAGNKLKVEDNGNNTYSYVQPNGKVTITLTFKLADGKLPWNPFADVTKDSWFHEAVKYVYENNLMNGAETCAFEPDASTTRGMIVTVLFRMEGSPTEFEKATFSDVAADSYYAKAIGWGFKNGIVKGYDEIQYGPEDNITREQMAAILYRYAEFKKFDLNKTTSLERFTDGKDTSDYAQKAMSWAVGNGLLTGKGDSVLDPTGQATRAEVATILMRFDAMFGKKA